MKYLTKENAFSQEGLKLIACMTMFLDHVGATIVMRMLGMETYLGQQELLLDLYYTLRVIGRIAFPLYCFLLVEGAHYTHSPKGYAQRLAVGVLLAELPFDLALNGGIDWQSNSVMLTLLLGYGLIESMKRLPGLWKCAAVVPFYLMAEWLGTDYGGNGILLIALFALTRGVEGEKPLRLLGMWGMLDFGIMISLGEWEVPIELFGILAAVPMFCYTGQKLTSSKKVQRTFYLFYPVHLLLLWLITLAL